MFTCSANVWRAKREMSKVASGDARRGRKPQPTQHSWTVQRVWPPFLAPKASERKRTHSLRNVESRFYCSLVCVSISNAKEHRHGFAFECVSVSVCVLRRRLYKSSNFRTVHELRVCSRSCRLKYCAISLEGLGNCSVWTVPRFVRELQSMNIDFNGRVAWVAQLPTVDFNLCVHSSFFWRQKCALS